MANFKTHITFGVLWSSVFTGGVYSVHRMNFCQILTAFVLVLIGAGLPDIDSDNAKPTRILFGILGIACPVLLLQRLPDGHWKIEEIFCWTILAFLFFQYVLAFLFSKLTEHRGMIHSLPAALVSGESVYLLFFNSVETDRIVFAAAMMSGYLTHLVLDEIFSVDLFGMRLKRSAGSALSWRSESVVATLVCYGCAIGLGWLIYAGKF